MRMIVTLALAGALAATCNLAIANDWSPGRSELIAPAGRADFVQQRQPRGEEDLRAIQLQNLISQRERALKLLKKLPVPKQGRDCTVCKNMGN